MRERFMVAGLAGSLAATWASQSSESRSHVDTRHIKSYLDSSDLIRFAITSRRPTKRSTERVRRVLARTTARTRERSARDDDIDTRSWASPSGQVRSRYTSRTLGTSG